MTLYIINSTAIWLLALLAFDVMLKNDTAHAYNRFYLLVAMTAGALLPLWSWSSDAVIYATGVTGRLAEQTAVMQDAIETNSAQQLLGWEDVLEWIYVTGLVISALQLFKDMVQIALLYRRGKKSKDGTWIIVETGKTRVPFSAFRYVFISSKEDYEPEELKMILAHEEYHGHLLHVADVLFARMMLVVFWYNPVLYFLEKRLRMVHEYQVDASLEVDNSVYSRFLVEQSVLNAAPRLAHSFTSSPLKNRLVMLTRKTNRMFSGRQLVMAPVLIISLLCFTQNAFSGGKPEKDGNKIIYKGNVFETQEYLPDTLIVVDPVTGKENMVVTRIDRPARVIKMNGDKVVEVVEMQGNLDVRNAYNKIKSEIGEAISPLISKLSDGNFKYDVHNIIINKKGQVVYYELGGVEEVILRLGNSSEPIKKVEIDNKVQVDINKTIAGILDNIKLTPIVMDKQPQVCALSLQEHFEVE